MYIHRYLHMKTYDALNIRKFEIEYWTYAWSIVSTFFMYNLVTSFNFRQIPTSMYELSGILQSQLVKKIHFYSPCQH